LCSKIEIQSGQIYGKRTLKYEKKEKEKQGEINSKAC
jgi:hypothetical protein